MSKIRVLSEHLSNRIAAGEVIERPASVVKELVENAIDAGATRITVHVERAGNRLICVTDNGSGMDADDALLCLEPHGTSKIREEEDIHRIETLGFRGEAIPSIAAISRFTIRSRTAESPEGIQVTVQGGSIQDAIPAGCPVGTRMEVRDLFYNTPARKKFLKSPQTEEHHIEEALLLLALPYPEIAFELYFDGKRAISSPASET
ncbi:MAG: ATP-binding protein, partial [Lentisphaeria bacterium]|nr:ATP-binding protein [Lentisphaeria bacterium]